jgi:hypothetical protein
MLIVKKYAYIPISPCHQGRVQKLELGDEKLYEAWIQWVRRQSPRKLLNLRDSIGLKNESPKKSNHYDSFPTP